MAVILLDEECSLIDPKGFPKVTISLGVACFAAHGNEGGQVLLRADRALYQAKKEGRNRVHAGQS